MGRLKSSENADTISILLISDNEENRKSLSSIINSDKAFKVVGYSTDPYDARHKIKAHNPSVIILDQESLKIDHTSFLKKIMSTSPISTLVMTAMTEKAAKSTLFALSMGATDFFAKPTTSDNLAKQDLFEKIKISANAFVFPRTQQDQACIKIPENYDPASCIVAIGSSTGGVEAISQVISSLPEQSPPILIAHHMHQKFTRTFAEAVNATSRIQVIEAENNMPLKNSTVYISPGNQHMILAGDRKNLRIQLARQEPITHKPSIDLLFQSVAEKVGSKGLGVLLTGSGTDGTQGLLQMLKKGADTVAQNQETSLLFEMPKSAITLGAVRNALPLNQIAAHIVKSCVRVSDI